MNTKNRKIWDENKIGIEQQFHDWYHDDLTSEEVGERLSEMYKDYCVWKTSKQKAFGDSFKKLEQSD